MNNDQIFSQFYSSDIDKHIDKIKFRNRIINYLHDMTQRGYPKSTYQLCRHKMGITIPIETSPFDIKSYLYNVEKILNTSDAPISDILDFITVLYDSWEGTFVDQSITESLRKEFILTINQIFSEESMCYFLQDNGRVRYFPDEEFLVLTRATLNILNHQIFLEQRELFNTVLDDLYKNHGKESPIKNLHQLIESFVLSIVGTKFNILNDDAVKELIRLIEQNLKTDVKYTPNDIQAVLIFKDQIFKWGKMCHKYRHGKPDQEHHNVPLILFNYIFAEGVNIYRFLLELDVNYSFRNQRKCI